VLKQACSKSHQAEQIAIVPASGSFSHNDACRIADLAMTPRKHAAPSVVVIDMKNAADATTSAFARLVLLRRLLLKTGRDLRLTNLRDRAMSLYQINRLAQVLPCM
jgi:hypothetical protein